ncbi:MAG: diguanylate cyclase [bacterium]|nr:MAG: diguanylate cyclase [bacterium]KAF0147577.1 MAG: diguanylate cyclase [bacterium]KAF0169392.1 MAG: diguanylate cyclase [bacterium]TXT17970.1 MAG: diguanylate cyclase [bacterium]
METPKQPVDIAREAIRLLTRRQLPPTPDNFRKAYADVSGQDAPEEASWPAVLRPLLKQWEAHQTGLAQSRKREMLERVLINFGKDGRLLQEKLAALAKTWAEGAVGEPEESPASAPAALEATDAARDNGGTLRALADNLRRLAADCDARWPDLAGRAFDLARTLDGGSGLDAARYEAWSALWKDLLARVNEEHELSAGLKRLMGLLFLNIGELVGDEAWLSGQFAAMEQLMAGDLQAEALLEAERGLRELAHKQGVLKGSLDEARDRLKTLITTFIDRVGDMSRDADGYQARIGGYSERIGQARDIAELGDLMGDLSADVGGLRDALLRNHGELVAARAEAEQAEERVRELERELAQVSVLVREDQLTGALNRRGMDEAFARELARADRLGEALSVGLLDIDHFKKLNDGHGHQAGDEALRHLARVVRGLLRPTDSLARYGGEEFLILLPNSDVAEAERILQRIQRELTRQFFMHDNERVLITFSAGVAQRQAGEDGAALLARADAAMYQAKSLGRNRVERG